MRIAVLGKNGQVGQACLRALASHELLALSRQDFGGDLTNLSSLVQRLEAFSPEIIINAAAYTAVDQAEYDVKSAYDVNVKAPEVLAKFSKQVGSFLIHLSTDYVFDGCQSKAYSETQIPHPLNVYGLSKLEGEDAILKTKSNAVILRLTWVHAATHHNFITSLLKWFTSRTSLSIVDDQWGIPTSANEVARGVRQVVAYYEHGLPFKRGVYHFASKGACSRYECAQYVKELLVEKRLISEKFAIKNIKSDQFLLPALRPTRAILEHSCFDQTFNFVPQHWKEGVRETVSRSLSNAPE